MITQAPVLFRTIVSREIAQFSKTLVLHTKTSVQFPAPLDRVACAYNPSAEEAERKIKKDGK